MSVVRRYGGGRAIPTTRTNHVVQTSVGSAAVCHRSLYHPCLLRTLRMDKLRSVLQRALGTVKQHMGTDQFGNKYYYVPEQKTWTGQAMRARRMVEPVQKDVYKYQIGHIPTEWEAWIRGKRKDPPTIEEILKNAQLRQDISAKGEEFLKNEKAMSSIESKDGVQAHSVKTQIKGHASAPVYEKQTLIEEPTSTANTFVPGSWNPQKK
ncbi:NADH dehydrogenase [ubiquinone] 1 alpha subcomplex assembly factor 2 isoform X1 [Rhinoderma darwinii]|uniref:NADH dehydrogenase [ubiquinone] 1 alpha subcomplex assembly factor 2 isoform X1 n=1 Tax=Rhinoderma darwinii TaxID=43563 RepID=UPI003F6752B4